MNFKKAFFLGVISSLFFISCNDEEIPQGVFAGKPIRFETEIVNNLTRASGTEWVRGDEIGIYMKTAGVVLSDQSVIANNKKHTTTGDGKFVNATDNDKILFPDNGDNVDFIAYYPYKAGLTQYFYPINVGGDQNNKLSDIDLLYSDNLINKNISSNDAILGFTHQMATIVLNIENKTGNNLAGMIVTISGTKTNADFSLIDGSFIDDGTVSDIIAATTINGTEATSQAIIIPIKSLTGAKILFNIPSHGKTYTWDIPTRDFDSKNKYSYDIEIKDAGVVVLNPNSNITDWIDNPGGTIEIGDGESEGGDGTQGNPYTVDQLSEKIGETGKWVEGYIVGSTLKTSRVVGTPSTENILIAATAEETDEAKCIPVDIATSAVKANLDIVANPELIGKKIKLQGDIVDNIFSNTLSLTNVTAQEGGATVGGGGNELEFFETFGPTWREEGQTGTQTKNWTQYIALDQFDMKSPIVYTTGDPAIDFRSTFTYDNPHIWFAANSARFLKVEGIEPGYTGMKLTYDIACNLQAGGASSAGILIKCNDVEVAPPTITLGGQNEFSTVSIDIPNGTTTVEFYTTAESNPTNYGYRLDNIRITGTK